MGDLIQAIAFKFGGQYAVDSAVWSQAADTTVEYILTIPATWVAYLIEQSGYTSGGDMRVTFIDQDGFARFEWTELLDTQKIYEILPFMEKFYKSDIIWRFKNESSATRTTGWCTTFLIIPESNRLRFEKAIKKIADIVK
jgi:hypothetical protein